jgi:hypothetical protein
MSTPAVEQNPAEGWPWLRSPWAVVAVLGLAVVLRGGRLADWSLWEDEETSIYFSQHSERPFPRFFPVFFVSLGKLYQITGVSVAAGRAMSAALGVLGVALLYLGVRRIVSREVALLAALLLAVNLGHLFWSQSIRYFILLFLLEGFSVYGFLEGLERGKVGWLVAANAAYALSLWTHFSAVLLTPIFVSYMGLMICARQRGGLYNLRGYLIFGLPHLLILGLFAAQMAAAQKFLGSMVLASARDPLHILLTAVAYFGAPVVVLALLAPFVARGVPGRILQFLGTLALLPLLEVVVIAGLNLSNVAWYYAFIALGGWVSLAGIALMGLLQQGRKGWAVLGGAAALGYSGVLLGGYYTFGHGDRPRWADAAALLREAGVRAEGRDNPEIYATVPGPVAYYLGVPPGETMTTPLVKGLPNQPPTAASGREEWFVVEAKVLSGEYRTWLAEHCQLKGRFEAWTGPVDRSVLVYQRPGLQPGPTRQVGFRAGAGPAVAD